MPLRVAVALALVLAALPVGQAEPASVVVAVLDSGIREDHVAFAPGQVVAWFDFTNHAPRQRLAWDPVVARPYDDHGHGTAVASMAAGLPMPGLTRSHAPGASLAIAKVLDASGSFSWMDLAEAIRWSVDVAGADVISVSLYGYAPEVAPASSAEERAVLDALAWARAKGALPVVLAGNGAHNAGLPTSSYFHAPARSPDALVVGGARGDGSPVAPEGSLDPEVTANYSVMAACIETERCVRTISGTSFATPLVAGAAARLLRAAAEAGASVSPRTLEEILKSSARDTLAPPVLEGYGFLGWPELDAAEARARTGDVAQQPPIANVLYDEVVQDGARRLWSARLLP